jgi:translation initiation factor eIF-2B subunit alpha
MAFSIYDAYKTHLLDDQISAPLAGILALTEMIKNSDAGTMFELTKELKDAAESLKKQAPNPIGLSAGCELFVAFVTLFPHDSAQSFSDLRNQLVQHGEKYVEEGLTYRQKIARLSLAFIKDDSVVRSPATLPLLRDPFMVLLSTSRS